MRPSPLAVASALVLSATTLAACGGGVDKNAYVDSVTQVQQSTSTEASKVSTDMATATTPQAIATRLEQLGNAVERNSVRLDKIEAPKDVESEHQQYVDLMAKFGTDLEGLAGRVRAAKPDEASKLLTSASKITSDLATNESKLVQDINTKLRG